MYVDGFVFAVPAANRERFAAGAGRFAQVLRAHGATRVVECWGEDVPEGKTASFPMAVKLRKGEVVCFSWVEYPGKDTRESCRRETAGDPLLQGGGAGAFDGTRMIYGGFVPVVEC